MSARRIALVGDYSDRHTAHRAIPRALELSRAELGVDVSWEWVATRAITDGARDLEGFSALWVVPASPYENTAGALGAVQWAREAGRPFLGTCGGFQHALLEFARNAAGIPEADHAETHPGGGALLVTPLSCSHVETTGVVHFAAGSLLARAYGRGKATEGYHCNYGFNPVYRETLEAAGLRFTAWDSANDIRGAELPAHPFFAGVLFQPERAALRGETPPLVRAFVRAAAG
ncbi:MAG TPA: CTP synthase [Opitutaceae bacterium]